LESNGGKLTISDIATYEGFEESVWFSEEAITNILSLAAVKREYEVSYNEDAFIIHRARHGYPDMVFKPHASGLHVLDANDPRSVASYAPSVRSLVRIRHATFRQDWPIRRFPI
jgi:hypothetical protein